MFVFWGSPCIFYGNSHYLCLLHVYDNPYTGSAVQPVVWLPNISLDSGQGGESVVTSDDNVSVVTVERHPQVTSQPERHHVTSRKTPRTPARVPVPGAGNRYGRKLTPHKPSYDNSNGDCSICESHLPLSNSFV